MGPPLGHRVILWTLFFLICMGLGYPTLNRYDPRNAPGVTDSEGYYSIVLGGTDAGDESHRVLVPYLARPIYWLANNHLHTWNPVFFALLVVNSFFIATSASLLVVVGYRIVGDYATAMLAGVVYLADFAVANFNLSGMADSAVNCLLMAVVWALLTERWWLLQILGACQGFFCSSFVGTCIHLVADSFPTRYFPTLATDMDSSDPVSRVCDVEVPDVDGTESIFTDELCRFALG